MNALVRLALRALGAPGQVRPRLGGLFERDTGGDAGETAAAAAQTQPTVLRISDQVVAAPMRGQPPAAAGAPYAPGERSTETAATPFDALPTPLDAPLFTAPRAHTAADPAFPTAPTPPHADREPPSPEGERRVVAPLIERTIRETVHSFDRDGEPRGLSATPAAYQPLLPERAARPAPARPLGTRETPTAGPADIQISIGRVEVRGEPEPRRPSPAPRRGAKLMSLEDYLAKGGRR